MIMYGGNIGGMLFTLFLLGCCVLSCLAFCGSLDESSLNPNTSSGGVFKQLKFSNSMGGSMGGSLGDSASPLKSLKFW
jgi:hypothetical protein